MLLHLLPAIVTFLLIPASIFGQIVSGYVLDAVSGEALPAANIQIEGTLRGAITNKDGKFNIPSEQIPATLLISYIGYESQRVHINQTPDKLIKIFLQPVILEAEAIVVTAENPAMAIMRKVIERKQIWQKQLQTFQAEAYSRVALENDSGIVSISESVSEVFWHYRKGPREVILSRRQTNNMTASQNFAFSSGIPNFYDDDIEMMGFKIVGPTHPNAFDFYSFKLIDRRLRDNLIVYDIEVIPESKLQPTFEGTVSVLDSAFALLAVDLKPSANILFPPPIQENNLFYEQQFSNFGREFWLPVDVRVNGDIKIGFTGLSFPRIIFSQITHLNNYQINVSLPDSLYQDDRRIHRDSLAVSPDSLFNNRLSAVPMSEREELAYVTIDSTMRLEEAFKPTGFLAKMADITVQTETDTLKQSRGPVKSFINRLGPQVWFNRVDLFHLGLTYGQDLGNNWRVKGALAWKTGPEDWGYEFNVQKELPIKTLRLTLETGYRTGTQHRFGPSLYSMPMVSLLPLLGRADYFDYFWSRAGMFRLHVRKEDSPLQVNIGLNDEWHSSVQKRRDINVLNQKYKQRANPAIQPGNLRSLEMSIHYGDDESLFGLVGQNGISLNWEHSAASGLGGDFTFDKYDAALNLRFSTFLKRRLLPNVFDVRIVAGTSTGHLPLQKMGGLDGSLYAFTPFGSFKTLAGRHYEGEHYAAVFWEHNFRTVPFELLGMDFLARKGLGIIVSGAHGRTWLDDKTLPAGSHGLFYLDDWHNEAGISLNSLFGFLRVDVNRRLDRPVWYLGFSFARLF